jgi:hypothetical protein
MRVAMVMITKSSSLDKRDGDEYGDGGACGTRTRTHARTDGDDGNEALFDNGIEMGSRDGDEVRDEQQRHSAFDDHTHTRTCVDGNVGDGGAFNSCTRMRMRMRVYTRVDGDVEDGEEGSDDGEGSRRNAGDDDDKIGGWEQPQQQ